MTRVLGGGRELESVGPAPSPATDTMRVTYTDGTYVDFPLSADEGGRLIREIRGMRDEDGLQGGKLGRQLPFT